MPSFRLPSVCTAFYDNALHLSVHPMALAIRYGAPNRNPRSFCHYGEYGIAVRIRTSGAYWLPSRLSPAVKRLHDKSWLSLPRINITTATMFNSHPTQHCQSAHRSWISPNFFLLVQITLLRNVANAVWGAHSLEWAYIRLAHIPTIAGQLVGFGFLSA